MEMQMEREIHIQRKVSGFEGAMLKYRQTKAQAEKGVVSKRKEEFVAYVERVCFVNDEEIIPSLFIQQRVVDRMRDLNH